MVDLWVFRGCFFIIFAAAGWFLQPLGLSPWGAALLGVVAAGVVVLFEIRLRMVSLRRLIGAAIGSVLGIAGAFLINLVLSAHFPPQQAGFVGVAVLLLMTYVGLVVGGQKGDMLNLNALGGLFGGEKSPKNAYKILDTSVIIDGRISDVAETGFLDGVVVVPQFVLWELQLVADSSDSLKRNRGRRGLDILHKIQNLAHIDVQIVENDYPNLKDVDLKLIELAKEMNAKVVTNDFNLNKLARLQGVGVLNINELANALKPVVLPGELMHVFILKEGKEYNQGVAYLDDGTMVVVDNARRHISKNVEIQVTSVLQTTAGKMIFGRCDERGSSSGERPAVTRSSSGTHPAAPAQQKVGHPSGH